MSDTSLEDVISAHALHSFKRDVFDRSELVDPDGVHDWDTLAYGYFIGMGMSPSDAFKALGQLYELGWL